MKFQHFKPVMIAKMGYPAETHTVTTEDCYILTMHRIPYGKKSPPVEVNFDTVPCLGAIQIIRDTFFCPFLTPPPPRDILLSSLEL